MIGSVARPLWKEVPRFWRQDVAIWHECKDVDLAVSLSRLDRLRELNRARNVTANRTFEKLGVGVANHEVDIFILEPGTDRYLGRLCNFAQCPKGKRACEVPGCGAQAFLQRHADFVFWPNALNADRMIPLYRRGQGIIRARGRHRAPGPKARLIRPTLHPRRLPVHDSSIGGTCP